MTLDIIDGYYKSNVYKPFYLAVGDDEYGYIKSKLLEAGDVEFVHLSKCCRNDDKKPDMDKLRETLRMADVDCDSNKIVLLGLGEYLALEGADKASKILNELISFNLGSAHAIFLLRGVSSQVKSILDNDPRYANRQIFVSDSTTSSLSFTFSTMELGMFDVNGFKKVLEIIENGNTTSICANTTLTFPESLFQLQIIKNHYEALIKKTTNFNLPKQLGSDSNWEELLKEINECGTMENLFQKHGFSTTLSDFYSKVSGTDYSNWLYYIFLLKNSESLENCYLKYVLSISNDFEDFKYKFLNAISEVSHTASNFNNLYLGRKELTKQFPESDIALFVSNNRFNPDESIYKLTDNTLVEREEIIADISQHGFPHQLEKIYPDLALYLKKYCFHGDALNDVLTDYFEKYKQQKVLNNLDEDFLTTVDQLALNRDYNRLRTRDEIVSAIPKESSFLCWVDALGVEYLGYIVELAQRRGLAISVNVGRAMLPTITQKNKEFFDSWPDENKRKIEELDDIKHNDKGGYKYGPSNMYPIHLAKELKIISNVIDEASTDLGLHKYEKFIIASDHGASRLAVIRKKEEKYDTDTHGEHSGRCCKIFSNYELPFATEENGYVVLADYGRFKNSRAANVEVHGGASLEEVVVPVITLSLRDSSIVIKLVDEKIKADYKTGISFSLYVNKPITQKLSVEYNGVRYAAVSTDANHYKVTIDKIKRACTVPADVYLGDDLTSHITLQVVSKSASMNSDFDDLF